MQTENRQYQQTKVSYKRTGSKQQGLNIWATINQRKKQNKK